MPKKKKNAAAVALGKLGGKAKVSKGIGTLDPEQRREIARQGAAARWGSKPKGKARTKPLSKKKTKQ